MSLLFKARGSSSFGLLLIRLVVGTYTLALGIMQASNVEAYINKIKAMQVFSDNTAFILGFATPFLLIVFGAMYIMGFFTPVTSFILAITAAGKLAVTGVFLSPGIPFTKDLIILTCYLLTLFSGAGIISFDALIDKKKKTATQTPKEEPVKGTELSAEPQITDTQSINTQKSE
ncbi:MAG: hypothetical protein N2510_06305 [Ignavibacteria bacterium]|nr:hypothetical protein [Ignavibacteria bacterium]